MGGFVTDDDRLASIERRLASIERRLASIETMLEKKSTMQYKSSGYGVTLSEAVSILKISRERESSIKQRLRRLVTKKSDMPKRNHAGTPTTYDIEAMADAITELPDPKKRGYDRICSELAAIANNRRLDALQSDL